MGLCCADAFSCYEFIDSEWLKADVAIQCGTHEHDDAKALAWAAIFFYPVGLLVLNAALLFTARKAISSGRHTPLSGRISFLYREFEPHLFWWELVEMLRRLVLVGLMVLAQGSMLQLVVGTMLSAVFLLFQVQASPYKEMSDDFLASASSFGLVLAFICAYAFKEYEIFGLRDIQDHMSVEQQDLYIVNQHTLTLIMLGSVLGTLVLSLILFVVQFGIEGARLRREAHAKLARRLWYAQDSVEAELAALPPWPSSLMPKEQCAPNQVGPFHVMLSHNWAQGQDQMRIVKTRLTEMLPGISVFLDVDALGNTRFKDFEHIDMCNAVVFFLTQGFLRSGPCIRELMRACLLNIAPITVLETDPDRGGLTQAEVTEWITAVKEDGTTWLTEAKHRAGTVWYVKDVVTGWANEWNCPLEMPSPDAIAAKLFGGDKPISWYALADLQDVSMRLIAQALLREPERPTYMQGEIAAQVRKQPVAFSPLRSQRQFHLFISSNNVSAATLGEELRATAREIQSTDDFGQLESCDRMLVYLHAQTWDNDKVDAFAAELATALRQGITLLLVHEVLSGSNADNEQRRACSFPRLIEGTPRELIAAQIYIGSIAFNLAGDEWRQAGLIRVVQRLAENSGARSPPVSLGLAMNETAAGSSAPSELKETSTKLQVVAAQSVSVSVTSSTADAGGAGLELALQGASSSIAAEAEHDGIYTAQRSFLETQTRMNNEFKV